MTLNIQAQKSN